VQVDVDLGEVANNLKTHAIQYPPDPNEHLLDTRKKSLKYGLLHLPMTVSTFSSVYLLPLINPVSNDGVCLMLGIWRHILLPG